MKVTLELTPAQLKVLETMGDVYGASIKERVEHIVVDVLAAEKRKQDEKAPAPAYVPTQPYIWPNTAPAWPWHYEIICSTDTTTSSVDPLGTTSGTTANSCICPPITSSGNWQQNPNCKAWSHAWSYTTNSATNTAWPSGWTGSSGTTFIC